MSEHPIVIAGGGIGGLAAALACAQAGRDAVVLERAPAFDMVGAGLQIGPNAVQALATLGAWEAVARIATAPPAILMQDACSGALVRRIALGGSFSSRFGAPYRVAHRADLHTALLACARRSRHIQIHNDREINVMVQDAAGVSVTTVQGTSHRGDMLVAADGMNSNLRQKLWPGSTAISAGQIMHRAMIDLPHDMTQADCVKLWMGPGFHVVHYPVGTPARLNIICVAHGGEAPQEIAKYACAEVRDLILSVPMWLPWEAKYVQPPARWHSGRVVLLGDAAHGTVPFLAQGAAMALEDAALLSNVLQRETSAQEAAASLGARLPRVRAVHAASVRQGKIYSAKGAVAVARNVALRMMPERVFFGQLSWLYGYRS